MPKPTEQQTRDVLNMLRESDITDLKQLICYDVVQGEFWVGNLNSISSTDELIEQLKMRGDIQ